MTAWLQTHYGRAVDLEKPTVDQIEIDDIAFALSRICRFTGHVDGYTVAQHSVLVMQCFAEAPKKASAKVKARFRDVRFLALLHDAHEAYVGDVSSPLGSLLPDFKVVSRRLEAVVHERFSITKNLQLHKLVRNADLSLLATERRDLMNDYQARPWFDLPSPREERIYVWTAEQARRSFLQQYCLLRSNDINAER